MLNLRNDKESGMFKRVILAVALTLLAGCTSKSEKALMDVYEKNRTYHKLLLKTEKIQFYENNESRVLVTATYLQDPAADEKQEDEVFVVGINTDGAIPQGLNEGEFSVTLEGKPAKSITPLEKNSPYLKHISFVSDWTQFSLVRFAHIDKKRFTLVFTSKTYGKGTLSFSKVAKYVTEKKSFTSKSKSF